MTSRSLVSPRLLLGATCGVLLLLGSSVSRAEEPPKPADAAKARALFSEARKLVDQGNYAPACGKFEESLRLNVGLGTQFNLADCWEHIGRTASARALFLGVAASARAVGQTEREQVAQARADALEPRLLRLLLDVRAKDAKLIVRRNQQAVEPWNWGNAVPVDPGSYLIEASAPGKRTWSARVTVPETATETVSLTIPPLEDPQVSCEAPAKSAEPELNRAPEPRRLTQPPPPREAPSPRSARRTGSALALASFGVVSAGVGAILGFEYKSKNDDAKVICPSGMGCSSTDIDSHAQLVSDAKTFRTWSFVGFGVGGAALIGAAALYFTPTSSASPASGWLAAPFVTRDGAWGATAAGHF
ncbi:MAG TPA: hypothetical protein VK745_08275 [Polyangiaceae bacterium]|jgi:hypothetical protein|nr:hypothetical protein [Polyangiaceae bacterium]